MKKYLIFKLLIILLLSFFISNLLIKEVFFAQTPKIRPNLGSYLSLKIRRIFNKASQLAFIFRLSNKTNEGYSTKVSEEKQSQNKVLMEKIAKQPLLILNKGVYARSDGGNTLIQIDMSQIDFVEYTFNVNGKEVKIKVPKGQEPPSQEVMNSLYK